MDFQEGWGPQGLRGAALLRDDRTPSQNGFLPAAVRTGHMPRLDWEGPVGTPPPIIRPPELADAPAAELVPSKPRRPSGRGRRPAKGKASPRFAVLGAGHGGLVMAGHLAMMGFSVNVWNRGADRVEHIRMRGSIELEGAIAGEGRLALATTDLKEALRGADIVMVAVPAHAHAEVAAAMAPFVRDGQIVVLNPGRTGGALEFRHVFGEKGVTADVTIAEAQTFLYTSRQIEPTSAHVFDVKNEVLLAALPSYRTPEVLKAVRVAYPQFIPGDNVLKTGLDNIGAIFHPGVMILNAGRIESTHGDFEYYLEGITPSVATILESMDRERVAVAEALGIHAHTAREWLYLVYHSAGRDLYQAIQATPGYKGITAPAHLNHRYILEDVPMSLVPMASLGEMLGVKVPTIRTVIHLASTIHGRDFWSEGRTVERLGLKGMSVRDIRLLVAGGGP